MTTLLDLHYKVNTHNDVGEPKVTISTEKTMYNNALGCAFQSENGCYIIQQANDHFATGVHFRLTHLDNHVFGSSELPRINWVRRFMRHKDITPSNSI